MQIELTGKVVSVLPTQSGHGKNGEWVKNAFVIEWQDNGYTQKLCLEVVGADKFEKMKNAVRVGNDVLVRFSVSSREWQNKWFTSCQCFYCSTIGGQQTAAPSAPRKPQTEIPHDGTHIEDDSQLPF